MNQNGLMLNFDGPGPGGQGPSIRGKFFHKDTGKEIFVRDSINCFGVDAGGISDEDYLRLMESQEFYEMNVWPKKNSIRMIDGYAVIKYSNNPLLPYW